MGKKLEEWMKEEKKTGEKQEQNPANIQNLDGFIYVPSVKLYVTKERSLHGLNWNKTQEELKKQKLSMLTPYQFREFLKYLRDSKDSEHKKIFKDVVEVRDHWRAEWLNARFDKRKNGLYMISENVLVNGKYQNAEQKLDDFLAENKLPGISLDEWINSNAPHGLPTPQSPNGKLYYWAPVLGYVARFFAGSDVADLSCDGDADYSDPSLGVRIVREAHASR